MKVLIALDGSECSAIAFDSITERSWSQDTEFRIYTVLEPAYMPLPPFGATYSEPFVEAQLETEKYCRAILAEKVDLMKKALPDHQVSGELGEGYVAETIIDEATRWNADLIIVGTHGRKGAHRFFLGSVAERVAIHSPCSVEIVKQKPACETNKVEKTQEAATVCGKV